LITKGQKIIIVITVVILILTAVFFTFGTNPIMHLLYSDDYMLKTAMNSEVVKAFNDMYPDSKVRYVRALDQSPAIVFEMEKDSKMSFLAVGNFEGRNLGYMYKCLTPDYSRTFFDITPTLTINDIVQNPCFVK
jgi:hypothetical protein